MFALLATSMAGTMKVKRGLLPSHGLPAAGFGAEHSFGPALGHSSYAAPLAPAAYAAPLAAAPAPLAQVQNTQSVERINIPQPYPVEKTIVKTIGIDRPVPVPQPYTVVKHVPQPYPVERQVPQVSAHLY